MALKWGTETTIKFIEMYKKNVCLWNADIPDYKSRKARETAYDNLVRGMNLPGFTVQEVKNKIKNLRSTYCQEVKKIAESKRSGGPIYEPSLKWVKNIEPVFTYVNTRAATVNSVDYTDQEDDPIKADEKPSYLVEKKTQKRFSNKQLTVPLPCKKRKIDRVHDVNRLEAFDAFGKSVGMQLKSLSEERALMAQSQIQTLLTEYGMADLKDKRSNGAGVSFTFVSSKEVPISPSSNCSNASPRSNCSNDDDGDSVISMPEAKYFDRYPDELLEVANKID